MAQQKDMQHFLRFSLLAVFCIACLAVLGLASLVLDGPGTLRLSSDAVAGDATASVRHYYVGDLALTDDMWKLRLSPKDLVLYVTSQQGASEQVSVHLAGEANLVGMWQSGGQNVPVSIGLVKKEITFHFPDGKVSVPLRSVY